MLAGLRAAAAPARAVSRARALFARRLNTSGLSAPINGYDESKRPKLFIPGPIEMSPEVLAASGGGMRGFVDPTLMEDFGKCIEMIRKTFLSKNGQPFIISGSGAMGWDAVCCNLMKKGDKVLQVNSGFFSTRFEHTYTQYGMDLLSIGAAKPGVRPDNGAIEKALKDAKASGKPFRVLSISGVDTSTAVLADLKALCDISKAVSPETLIIVDAVCSAAGEELRMDEWGVDFVMTGSQKAFGVPPGLCILICSERVMAQMPPVGAIPNYFVNLQHWLPIMKNYEARQPSYFATPAVQLIGALRVGLEQMHGVPGGIEGFFKVHREMKTTIHNQLDNMNLQLLTDNTHIASNLLSTIRYPKGKGAGDVLPAMKERGWILAGGIHPECANEYFRVGHMGYSVTTKPEYIHGLLKDLDEVCKA